jgi:hypothetical protein
MGAEWVGGWRVEGGLRALVMRHRAGVRDGAKFDPTCHRGFDLGDDGEALPLRQPDGGERPIEVGVGPDERAGEVNRGATEREPVGVAKQS